ncbi:MAG: glucose-6-phosphate isomerase [Myxococcales bacterium]|nr:glucose-6-phosphate isomerase [Myxococcales bacterium]
MVGNDLSLDYSLCMGAAIGDRGGLTEDDLATIADRATAAADAVAERVNHGELGFWQLPGDAAGIEAVEAVVHALPEAAREVLVLGIGGSSLGAQALLEALLPPRFETAPAASPRRLHFFDNSDPFRLAHALEALDPRHCAMVVVSKSGGTVETAAQLRVVRPWIEAALGEEAATRCIAVTDPEHGALRKEATNAGWQTLPIPSNVGGRFSVLGAAGLLPARLAELDARALLRGAGRMAERCRTNVLHENPALMLAALCHLHDRARGHHIDVLMPYSDRLRAFSAWFVQLWAESLGKRKDHQGQTVEVGPTPLTAVGATDQHAQMQLFMEGPRDKLLLFVAIADAERDLTIPHSDGPGAYLGGHGMAELLDAERRGTTQALASDGRPSLTLSLPRLDADGLGQLFFFFEAATAFAGELYGINAFDQPGVELGKRLAFGLLGRQGYEEAGREIEAALSARPEGYRID